VARSRAKSCRWSTPGTPRSFVVRREPSQSQTPVPLEVLRRAYTETQPETSLQKPQIC
jgi:hypothetical protein